jgi:hypothetical protein
MALSGEDFFIGVQEMLGSKAKFEDACNRYRLACAARNWAAVDVLQPEVLDACETMMDAVAMAYRRIEEAGRNGR